MEALRSVELTGTNSPCALYLNQKLPSSLSIYIPPNFLVAIEKRVHPIPFRTRKLSSLSPMILHIFMWESRPPPRIFRRLRRADNAPESFFFALRSPLRFQDGCGGWRVWFFPGGAFPRNTLKKRVFSEIIGQKINYPLDEAG